MHHHLPVKLMKPACTESPAMCTQIFSKLQTGRVPSMEELVALLEEAMGSPPAA